MESPITMNDWMSSRIVLHCLVECIKYQLIVIVSTLTHVMPLDDDHISPESHSGIALWIWSKEVACILKLCYISYPFLVPDYLH